ncbi:protein Daple-like isoform X2 [Episyrphus balteatus]|uniref:protein Daple-like isoform X2 n=1 Tax=Episyrphus balteatus TaxID=286459 RepID=UPI0024851145|nr:protein Daple-like isoform X2 [Episyrphus balteatus]
MNYENLNMEAKHLSSNSNDSNNQENVDVKNKKNQNKQKIEVFLSKDKTKKNLSKSQLLLLNETAEQRELRLQKQREYKKSRTPEQREASRLKNALYTRRYREEQLNAARTAEEREALIQKRKEYSKNYREKLKSLAKTPEEKEALRMKIVLEKRRSVAKLQKLADRDCKGNLLTFDEIEARRKKRQDNDEELSLLTLKKRWQATIKMREYRQRNRTIGKEISSGSSPRMKKEQQITPNFVSIKDEIKIEKEVFQESTIHAYQNTNSTIIHQDAVQDSSGGSWFEPSVDILANESKNYFTDYYRSFSNTSSSLTENIPNTRNHSTTIERRKRTIEASLNCLRELIDVTARGDRFAVFGEHIAQKLRSNEKDQSELNYAKLQIDNVLQSLELGFYGSETQIVKVEKNY